MEDIGGNQQLVGEQSVSAHANTPASTITLHIPEPLFVSSTAGKKKNFVAHFYGWGSAVSRLQPLQRDSLLFTTKPQEVLLLI